MLKGKRLVVIGTGWGGFSFFSSLKLSGLKSLTVISPRNYFLFTPLLPGVTTGTTESRSIMDPIRTLIEHKKKKYPEVDINYYEMKATDIDLVKNECLCEPAVDNPKYKQASRSVPYDILVLAPGAKPNNFNTPGVDENCLYLKEIPQARVINNSILDAFEAATLTTDPVERANLLHFVVVGGGPTGVEFASELRDFLDEDLKRAYNHLVEEAKVTIVQAGDLLLNTYDKGISKYAEDNFKRIDINVIKNTAVVEVGPKTVKLQNRMTNEVYEIPHGLVVWAAGVAPRAITRQVIKNLGTHQTGARLILTDGSLKVKGTSNVYALGDCSMIEQPRLVEFSEKLFTEADLNKDGKLQRDESNKMISRLVKQYPLVDLETAQLILEDLEKTWGKSYLDKPGWTEFLKKLESNFKTAPATAQVAQQQGEYLADLLTGSTAEPWKRVDRGMMSYVGSSRAVMQTSYTGAVTGVATYSLWRGAYASKLFSWRCRVYTVWDWLKKTIYGRDISRM